jgi:hypothetical protein
MRHMRLDLAFPLALLLLAPACGGDDTQPAETADAGGADALTSDPDGIFQLAISDSSILTGYLVIDAAAGTATLTNGFLAGGTQGDGVGTHAAYSFTGSTMVIGSDSYGAEWQPAATPPTLALDLNGEHLVFHTVQRDAVDSITIGGRIVTEAEVTAPPVGAHVAMVSLLRGANDTVDFVQVPSDVEPGLDVPIDLSDFVEDFSMTRSEGALGLERIAYGQAGSLAVEALVVYEDRDGAPGLGRWAFDDCSDGSVDCIRGISHLFLAYRNGESVELAASAYGDLLPGWTPAALVDDHLTDGVSLGTLDDQRPTSFDIRIPADPGTVVVPGFVF